MNLDKMLEEIEARANAATKGPWECGYFVDKKHFYLKFGDHLVSCPVVENGEFIVHARTDIQKLIAALRLALYYVEGDATYEILCTRMAAILQPNDSEVAGG